MVGAQRTAAPGRKTLARFHKLPLPECQGNEESGSFARRMDFSARLRFPSRPIFQHCAAVPGMVYDASDAPVAQYG